MTEDQKLDEIIRQKLDEIIGRMASLDVVLDHHRAAINMLVLELKSTNLRILELEEKVGRIYFTGSPMN